MYIEKYKDELVGGTDDSLALLEYLAGKGKEEIPLSEVFSDIGLDQLNGDFRRPETELVFTDAEGWEMEFHYAIDLLMSLAALLLECRESGSVDLSELFDAIKEGSVVRLTATEPEHALIDRVLRDFSAAPLEYDLAEMMAEEDMLETARLCGELRSELYGS